MVLGLFLGTQCSSWSRALRGPPGSSWCSVRSLKHIYGLPNLSDSARRRVQIGNIQVRHTAAIINACRKIGVPCMLENPRTSMLWHAPCISRLLHPDSCMLHQFDQCQYGTRWKKATTIAAWGCGHCAVLNCSCKGKGGIGSTTKKPHIVLPGYSKAHKRPWTSVAQEYPPRLASRISDVLIVSSRLGMTKVVGL